MAHRLISLSPLIGLALSTALLHPARAFDDGHGGTARGVRVETLARSTQDWTGARLPPYPAGQPQVTVLRISVPPGVRLDPHHHRGEPDPPRRKPGPPAGRDPGGVCGCGGAPHHGAGSAQANSIH